MIVVRMKKRPDPEFSKLVRYDYILESMLLAECMSHNILPIFPFFSIDAEALVKKHGKDLTVQQLACNDYSEVIPTVRGGSDMMNTQAPSTRNVTTFFKDSTTAHDLAQYGTLTFTTLGKVLTESGSSVTKMVGLEPWISRSIAALDDSNVAIVDDSTSYNDIVEYAQHRLRERWCKGLILDLLCVMKGVGHKFNEKKEAIYHFKPSLQGSIKSEAVLQKLDLESIFKPEDFEDHQDEVVSFMMKESLVSDKDVLSGLAVQHNGKYYFKAYCTQGNLQTVALDFGGSFSMMWQAVIGTDHTSVTLMPVVQDRFATVTREGIVADVEKLNSSAQRDDQKEFPIRLTKDELELVLIDRCSHNVHIRYSMKQPTIKLQFTTAAPEVHKINPASFTNMTGNELKDLLSSYGAPTSGQKEKLLERLQETIIQQYNKYHDEMYIAMLPLRGLLMQNIRFGEGSSARKELIDSFPSKIISRHPTAIMTCLIECFVRMHTREGVVFDPEFKGSLYTIEGLVETLLKESNPSAILILPEMTDVTTPIQERLDKWKQTKSSTPATV